MNPSSFTELVAAARACDSDAADRLLRRFEPWLRLLARSRMESRFGAKFDPADLVQQALLEAVRSLAGFRGADEAAFAAWLRGILAHVLAHEIRRYDGTQKRDLAREVSFDQELSDVSERLGDLLAADDTSPTQAVARQEDQLHLARVLERLPEDYRTVLELRHLEGLKHEEIAARLGRNPGAVRMLWARALARLKQEITASPDAPAGRADPAGTPPPPANPREDRDSCRPSE